MTTPTTQFIFLPAASSVRPEDVDSTEGKALLDLLNEKKELFGNVIWGRSVDKADTIGIGLEFVSSDSSFPLSSLGPFQAATPRTLLVRAAAGDLVANPVTEIAVLPLRPSLSPDQIGALSAASADFGRAILEAPAPVKFGPGRMALTYKSGWAAGEPSNRLVMMIGWREVDNHLDAMGTSVFQGALKPIMDVVADELDVTHFKFRSL